MTDPIADMLTRVRNALTRGHAEVVIPTSKLKVALAHILKAEGYIQDVHEHEAKPQGSITLVLKYGPDGRPTIRNMKRVSRPGRRHYVGKDEIPRVLSGLGTAIISTSKGIMTGQAARQAGIGGEVLCSIY